MAPESSTRPTGTIRLAEPQGRLLPSVVSLEIQVPVGRLSHEVVALAGLERVLELPHPRSDHALESLLGEAGSDPLQDQLGADGLLGVEVATERDLLRQAAAVADFAEFAR